ncbi:MAG: ATP-binding cassette domain-containing protein [Candidatus Methanomethylophilaceae archaeon]|nr:ATP-binding cassette domain-containing protein [Candidatus Methanomethylophilaceae archaeon]
MSENALEMKSVSVVRNGKYILKDIDLTIANGENVVILGPNGSGKTTLIKLFSGEIRPYYDGEGRSFMSIFGETKWNVFELRNKLGIVSMDLQNRFNNDVLVSDVILSGYFGSMDVFRNHTVTQDMVRAVYNAALRMGVEDKLERTIANLSLGEMRRVLIARALVSEPSMLILDEPMTGLDIVMKDAFRKMFDILTASGVNIIMITHELEDIPESVDRIIMLKDGEKIVDGKKTDVLTSENISNLFDADITVTKTDNSYHMTL